MRTASCTPVLIVRIDHRGMRRVGVLVLVLGVLCGDVRVCGLFVLEGMSVWVFVWTFQLLPLDSVGGKPVDSRCVE